MYIERWYPLWANLSTYLKGNNADFESLSVALELKILLSVESISLMTQESMLIHLL